MDTDVNSWVDSGHTWFSNTLNPESCAEFTAKMSHLARINEQL